MPVLLAGLSATLLGFGDFFAGMGGRRTDHPGAAISIAWLASVVGVVVSGLYVAAFPPEGFTGSDLTWTLAATVCASLARPLLYLGMERGPMVIFAPVVGIVSLVIPAVVGPLTGTDLSGLELAGVIIAVPAVVLIVADGALPSLAVIRASPALPLGIVTGALLGAMALFLAEIDPDAGAMPALISQVGAVLIIPVATRPLLPMAPLGPDIRRFAQLIGLLDITAIISLFIAFQIGNVVVVAAIVGFAPAITITMAWRVYHETVKRWQWAGVGLAGFSILLFSVAV